MSHAEAWVAALVGMATIVASLMGTILLARVYGRLAARFKGAHAEHAGPAPVPDVVPSARPDLPLGEPVPDDVLAVIAAVIDVERKLYLARPQNRLTIRRPTTPR